MPSIGFSTLFIPEHVRSLFHSIHKMAYLPLRNKSLMSHLALFAESDEYLSRCFRLPRAFLMDLWNRLEPALRSHTQRSSSVPPHVQVLSTWAFLATGTFQQEPGDRVDISQPSISRTLLWVVDAINQLATEYIKFPYTAVEQVAVNKGFNSFAGLPNTNGAIDLYDFC